MIGVCRERVEGLRPITGTVDMALADQCDRSTASAIMDYTGSNWASDHDDRKSTSGFLFKLSGVAVMWSSCKQSLVEQSTTDAEYIGCSGAVREAVCLRRLFADLQTPAESESFCPLLKGGRGLNDNKCTNTHEPKKRNTRRDTTTTVSGIGDTADETEARLQHAPGAYIRKKTLHLEVNISIRWSSVHPGRTGRLVNTLCI